MKSFYKNGNGLSQTLLTPEAYPVYHVPTKDSEKEKNAWIDIGNRYIKFIL